MEAPGFAAFRHDYAEGRGHLLWRRTVADLDTPVGAFLKLADGRPESIFKIRMAESPDGLAWQRRGADLIADVLDADECQASPDVVRYDGAWHMFFSYKYGSDFRGTDRGYRIGYASSHDLVTWSRDDAQAGIAPSGGDEWDGQSIAYPHVFELDGALYLLYLGNDVGRYGFGLAVLDGREHGMVSAS